MPLLTAHAPTATLQITKSPFVPCRCIYKTPAAASSAAPAHSSQPVRLCTRMLPAPDVHCCCCCAPSLHPPGPLLRSLPSGLGLPPGSWLLHTYSAGSPLHILSQGPHSLCSPPSLHSSPYTLRMSHCGWAALQSQRPHAAEADSSSQSDLLSWRAAAVGVTYLRPPKSLHCFTAELSDRHMDR
jgi:hypothetical protein